MIFYRKGGKRDDGTEDSMYDLEDKINQVILFKSRKTNADNDFSSRLYSPPCKEVLITT